jgi:hypothetical protein
VVIVQGVTTSTSLRTSGARVQRRRTGLGLCVFERRRRTRRIESHSRRKGSYKRQRLGRDGNQERIQRDNKLWDQTVELAIREDDPISLSVYASLFRPGKRSEHVDVPLSKFVNPRRQVVDVVCVCDDGVETFLKGARTRSDKKTK